MALRRIKLLASVPPEVKIISEGEAFKTLAICFRLFSITDLAFRPAACVDEGFPKVFSKTSVILFSTSG